MTGERRLVLITCDVFEPGFRGGGPVRSIARILDTASERIDPVLVTSDRDLGAGHAYPGLSGRWVTRRRARVFYLRTAAFRQWLRLCRDLRRHDFDLLYVNSFWSPLFTVLPVLAMRLGLVRCRRLLIAPRGELRPSALSVKSTKKRVFLHAWSTFLGRRPITWHASTEQEAQQIRSLCPRADIRVDIDQIDLAPEPLAPVPGGTVARLTFIGRISVLKNLHTALEALEGMDRAVEFDIYGPLEDTGYWARCRAIMDRLPGHVRARYRGELAPDRVQRTFAGYDAFVCPTLGENFGHAIAESLSASCPVVCYDTTPWTPVLRAGGGAVVHPAGTDALGAELRRIAAKTPAARLRDRESAGAAYRVWRAGIRSDNILDQALDAADSIAGAG